MKNKNILGKQYGYRQNAWRAIKKFQIKYFATIPKNFKLWVNKIDNGCYEIEGNN